jgi:flavin reductase (DIM6/NTAB) family NADH-FMN oxidoreductase RutF
MEFKKIHPETLPDNVFNLIDNEWMLITAGKLNNFNMMTASWGGLGVLWNKPVAFIFVRPQRYTRQFLEENNDFTLTFFDEQYRKALSICGSKSGRDINKVKETGLNPLQTSNGNVFFAEARLMIECKKLYHSDLDPANFHSIETRDKNYPSKDYHRMYIGEITDCLLKK